MLINFLKKYEKITIQILMVLMAIVLTKSLLDLAWLIITDITSPPYFVLDVTHVLDVFGMVMLVVIGVELLETMLKTYVSDGKPHHEAVLLVAIIAIARKVIILDVKKLDSLTLIGIAFIILSLTAGYFFLKCARNSKNPKKNASNLLK